MTKKILIFSLFLICPSMLFAGAKILAFTGKVEVRLSIEDEDWMPVRRDMIIEDGGTIRTGAGSAAVIRMPNKSKIWLRANSNLEIEENKSFATRIALLFGSIKLRVPHLLRREKFRVKTPTAICAIRGTEFTLSTSPEGKMRIAVLYGEVKLDYIVPPNKGKSTIYIPQGHVLSVPEKGKQGKHTLLTKAQESKALENWDPGLSKKDRQKMLREKRNDRALMRQFARATNATDKKISGFTNTVKESDIEAGRTLKDVHGNLVRVDQRLMRPDGQTLQFFNLVKRPVYNHVDHGGFTYNGAPSVSNRLDLLQMNMVFNRRLPDRMEEWAGFFDNDAVFATKAAFVAANKTSPENIFFIAEYYLRDEGYDELVNNSRVIFATGGGTGDGDRDVLITGVVDSDDFALIANVTAANSGFNIIDNGLGDGTLKYTDASGAVTGAKWAIKQTPGVYWESPENDINFKNFEADKYQVGGVDSSGSTLVESASNPYFWYARETYVINNGGGIAKTGDLTDSGTDPFSILKEHAFETVMYIKQDSDGVASADYFNVANTNYGNIDIVVIPDLGVAAIQRMLPILNALSD
ncbi:MAG: FecR family protein [Elusimicrobiota bacterium]|nr:FecR family protein [Elusimicrobiota bacterium]